ncbi:MAG: peptide chain release factor N(5)-glutamine methyltransferase [Pseudomonadota bacterium]
MTTLGAWLAEPRQVSVRDLTLLLAHGHDIPQSRQRSEPKLELSAELERQLNADVAALEAGRPLAYVLGAWEFYGLELALTPDTLIPRTDTEILAQLAIERAPENAHILDIGTGSGAIALAIAHHRPDCRLCAVDISAAALAIAERNAATLGLTERVRFVETSWCTGLDHSFDLIVSNPPYINAGDPLLSQLVDEPHMALASPEGGFAALHEIIASARSYLRPGGLLALEHGYDQSIGVRQLLRDFGYVNVGSQKDLAAIDRVSYGMRRA